MITYGKRRSVAGLTESKSNFWNTSCEPQVRLHVVGVVEVAHRDERARAPQLVGDEVVAAEEQDLLALDERAELGELVGVIVGRDREPGAGSGSWRGAGGQREQSGERRACRPRRRSLSIARRAGRRRR